MKKNIRVTISIYDFAEDPQILAKCLNIKPDEFRIKGIIPEGRRHPAKENSLIIKSRRPELDDLDAHIADILVRLPNEIKNVVNVQMVLRIVIYIKQGDTRPVSAMCMSASTVTQLAALGCEVDFDIYG